MSEETVTYPRKAWSRILSGVTFDVLTPVDEAGNVAVIVHDDGTANISPTGTSFNSSVPEAEISYVETRTVPTEVENLMYIGTYGVTEDTMEMTAPMTLDRAREWLKHSPNFPHKAVFTVAVGRQTWVTSL
jgi:hypothetical protein